MESIVEIIGLLVVVSSAAFAYIRFFREGTHKQRIEFDLELVDLNQVGNERIVEVGVLVENKGYVEHRFDQIHLKIRGIEGNSELGELEGYEPRLKFPLELHTADLIIEKDEYYFVRPKVKQRFPLTVKIPASVSHLLIGAEFLYSDGDFHKAERAFYLGGRTCDA